MSRTNAATEPWSETPHSNKPSRNDDLGDFTANWRLCPITFLAMIIGVVCAFVALALLRLIGLFTNLFYFGDGTDVWFHLSAIILAFTAS